MTIMAKAYGHLYLTNYRGLLECGSPLVHEDTLVGQVDKDTADTAFAETSETAFANPENE
jgi:hypothetical protein